MLQFLTYVAYGVLGLVWLGVGPEECVCWWRVALQCNIQLHQVGNLFHI